MSAHGLTDLAAEHADHLERVGQILRLLKPEDDFLHVAQQNHTVVKRLFVSAQELRAGKKRTQISRRSLATRLVREKKWEQSIREASDAWFATVDEGIDAAYSYAASSWKLSKMRWLRKDAPPTPPSPEEVRRRLQAQVTSNVVMLGIQLYVQSALATSVESGSYALQHMGINKTWAWAHPQAMAQDMFAVRGSKVIQGMYGSHMNQLTKIITRATDPRNPKTLQEVRAEIRTTWPALQAYQVDRIARTETAAVWTQTSANAYRANGITQFESVIATGPSIGIESDEPCDECVDAADDVHSMDDDLPPWHPNCRCEAVPVLAGEDGAPWLPPDEPFTGGEEGMQAEIADPPPDMVYDEPIAGSPYVEPMSEPVPSAQLMDDAVASRVATDGAMLDSAEAATSQIREAISNYGFENGEVRFISDAEGNLRGAVSYIAMRDAVEVKAIGSSIRGGGTEMLRYAARDAQARGLPVRLTSLPQSHGFYEKLGFTRLEGGLTNQYEIRGEALDHLASRTGEAGHAVPAAPITSSLGRPYLDPALKPTEFTQTEIHHTHTGDLWRAMRHNGLAENAAQEDIALAQDTLIGEELWARGEGLDLPKGTIRFADLKGERHYHSIYSDGHNTIEEMAREAIKRGEREMVISEHSNMMIDGPVGDPARYHAFEMQRLEINALNLRFKAEGTAFEVKQGVEVNLLKDGSLDLPDSELAKFDSVNVGMHEDRTINATERYLKAMDNEHVTTIAHPGTGGDVVDWEALAKKAREKGIALEVNGRDLLRRDSVANSELATGKMIMAAKKWGAKIQLGADAHNTANLVDSLYAVRFAAKRGVTVEDLLPEQRRILDDVSVPGERPVSAEALTVIKDKGLDLPEMDIPPIGTRAYELTGGKSGTRELYRDPASGDYMRSRMPVHDEYFRAKLETAVVQEKPVALVMAGGPASGKSVALRADPGMKPPDAVEVNPDEAMEFLPENKTLEGDQYKAHVLHSEAGDMAADLFQQAVKKRVNIVLDGVGNAEPGKFLSKLQKLKEAGYEVRVAMADAPVNAAIERNVTRATTVGSPDFNRFVPIRVQKQLYRDAITRMDEWMDSTYIDRWKLTSTAGAWGDTTTVEVAEGGGGSHVILNEEAWATVQQKRQMLDVEPIDARPAGYLRDQEAVRALNGDFLDSRTRYTRQDEAAIEEYQSHGFRALNPDARAGKITPLMTEMDSVIAKGETKRDLVVYRGIDNLDQMFNVHPGHPFGPTQIEDLGLVSFRDRGFLSTTTSHAVAERFAYRTQNGAVVELHVPKGTPASWISGLDLTAQSYEGGVGSEFELLFGRDHVVNITGYSRDAKGRSIIHAELAPVPEVAPEVIAGSPMVETIDLNALKLPEKEKALKEAYNSWQGTLTPEERIAYEGWQSFSYQIAPGLRTGSGANSGLIAKLDETIQRTSLPGDLTVYRGVRHNVADIFGVTTPEELIGKVVKDNSFLSTTISPKLAKDFAHGTLGHYDGAIISINLKAGQQAAWMNSVLPRVNTSYFKERELLLPRGLELRVTNASLDLRGGNWKIEMEVAGRAEPAGSPMVGRTGRSESGNLRSFKAMSDAKFRDTLRAVTSEANDEEALAALRAEAERRGAIVPPVELPPPPEPPPLEMEVPERATPETISADDLRVVAGYENSTFYGINEALRGKGLSSYTEAVRAQWEGAPKSDVAKMDKLIEAQPSFEKEQTMYRLIGANTLEEVLGAVPKVGTEFTDKGFAAITPSKSLAESFTYAAPEHSSLLTIKVPQGTRALDVQVAQARGGRFTDGGDEFLLGRDQTYRVTKIVEGKDKWVGTEYEIEIVPKGVPLKPLPPSVPMDVRSLKAELTSTRNRISGLNTRLKKLDLNDPRRPEVLQRLVDEKAKAESLKAQIAVKPEIAPPPEPPVVEPPLVLKPAGPEEPPRAWDKAITDGPATEELDKVWRAYGKGLTVQEKDAMWAYRLKTGFRTINDTLRGGKGTKFRPLGMDAGIPLEPIAGGLKLADVYQPSVRRILVKDAVRLLDGIIEKAPLTTANADMILFRGLGDARKMFGKDGPAVGHEYTDAGYASTTTEVTTAADTYLEEVGSGLEDRSVLLEIRVPKGTKGAWMRGVDEAFDGTNHEFVLPRGLHYKVVKVEDKAYVEYEGFVGDKGGQGAYVVKPSADSVNVRVATVEIVPDVVKVELPPSAILKPVVEPPVTTPIRTIHPKEADRLQVYEPAATDERTQEAVAHIEQALAEVGGDFGGTVRIIEQDGEVRAAVHYLEKPDGVQVFSIGSTLPGAGTALIKDAAEAAVRGGTRRLYLKAEPDSIAFYEKLGFTKTDEANLGYELKDGAFDRLVNEEMPVTPPPVLTPPASLTDVVDSGAATFSGRVELYRTGAPTDHGRGVFFAESPESASAYEGVHPGEESVRYVVDVKRAKIFRNTRDAFNELFPGKTVYGETSFDRAYDRYAHQPGVFEPGAIRKIDERIAAKVRTQGYDALIYREPAPPARHELAILTKKPIKNLVSELPPPAHPVAPVGPADIQELKRQVTSANNRISGLKTRIKRLESAGRDASDIRTRLAGEMKTRDELKARISGGGHTPPTAVDPMPAKPIEVDPFKTDVHALQDADPPGGMSAGHTAAEREWIVKQTVKIGDRIQQEINIALEEKKPLVSRYEEARTHREKIAEERKKATEPYFDQSKKMLEPVEAHYRKVAEERGLAFDNLRGTQRWEIMDDLARDTSAEGSRLHAIQEEARKVQGKGWEQDRLFYDQMAEAKKVEDAARGLVDLAEREATLATLSRLREMGPSYDAELRFADAPGASDAALSIRYSGYGKRVTKVAEAKKLLTKASDFYPRDWIKKQRAISSQGFVKRGFHSNWDRDHQVIRLSNDKKGVVPGDKVGFSTAVHELGHEVEATVDAVVIAERYFHEYRTKGEIARPLNEILGAKMYGTDEMAMPDEFSDPYMGKVYEDGRIYELLTMGMEGVFSKAEVLDPEYRSWVLGMLATL